jgi:hypothetical protein
VAVAHCLVRIVDDLLTAQQESDHDGGRQDVDARDRQAVKRRLVRRRETLGDVILL